MQTTSAHLLVLPLPPTLNHAYRNVTTPEGRRMRVPTNSAKQFTVEVEWLATMWAAKNKWVAPPKGQKVIMRTWTYWGDNRRQDTHNRIKFLADALEGILYPDDRWVLIQEQDFSVDRKNPRVEVELSLVT